MVPSFPEFPLSSLRATSSLRFDHQGIPYALNNNEREDAIKFFYQDNQLKVYAPFDLTKVDMSSLSVEDRQKEDTRELLEEMKLLEESLDLKINKALNNPLTGMSAKSK